METQTINKLKAIAFRLEAIASRVEAIANRFMSSDALVTRPIRNSIRAALPCSVPLALRLRGASAGDPVCVVARVFGRRWSHKPPDHHLHR